MGIVMLSISGFGLENVRCFAKKQRIRVRPLTFLVGNNSTGKTTALGCLSCMSRFLSGHRIDFNQPPYRMGGFADISRSNGRKRSFVLETTCLMNDSEEMAVAAEFADTGGLPAIRRIRCSFGSGSITCKFASGRALNGQRQGWKLSEGARNDFTITCDREMADVDSFLLAVNAIRKRGENSGTAAEKRLATLAQDFYRSCKRKTNGKSAKASFHFPCRFLGASPANDLGPVRSRPERAYTPTHMQSPEGDNVPMRLLRLQHENKRLFRQVSAEIGRFGKASGLFDGIEVRGMGTLIEPFQLLVKAGESRTSIANVGYGVSQLLPLLFEILATESSSSPSTPHIVLLQQPEVHLHPRSQAEFASFLARIAGKHPDRFRFVVETHSDFILNRTSIEIKSRTIAARDVSLAFFDMENGAAKISNIDHDDTGNLTNTPAGYRKFFNKEIERFLGLD